MEKQGLRIFAYFTVVLMLVSILPAGALAASDNANNDNIKSVSGNNGNGNQADDSAQVSGDSTDEDNSDDGTTKLLDRERDRDRNMVNATETATRQRTEAQNENMNAASSYQAAKDEFTNIRSKNPNIDSEEAIDATRTYLLSSVDYMTSLIDDEKYIAELNAERNNVEAATTRAELAESAKNIRSIWNDARKDRIVSSGKNIDNKISEVVKTSDAFTVRLENEITRMKENGEDVEVLENMLAEYQKLMDDAKENQEQARNAYMNGNGNNGQNIREANRYIVQAGKDIKDANAILRDILKELKQQREGVVVLTGNGTLTAEGNGTAVISGDVEIDLTATGAKLVIKDLAGDAEINVDDAEYESSNIDDGNNTDNNRAFVYINITGDVHVKGSRLTVMLRGSDIDLAARGTGTAVLAGEGTYDFDGRSDVWASQYAKVSSENVDEKDDGSTDVNADNSTDATEDDDNSGNDTYGDNNDGNSTSEPVNETEV